MDTTRKISLLYEGLKRISESQRKRLESIFWKKLTHTSGLGYIFSNTKELRNLIDNGYCNVYSFNIDQNVTTFHAPGDERYTDRGGCRIVIANDIIQILKNRGIFVPLEEIGIIKNCIKTPVCCNFRFPEGFGLWMNASIECKYCDTNNVYSSEETSPSGYAIIAISEGYINQNSIRRPRIFRKTEYEHKFDIHMNILYIQFNKIDHTKNVLLYKFINDMTDNKCPECKGSGRIYYYRDYVYSDQECPWSGTLDDTPQNIDCGCFATETRSKGCSDCNSIGYT
jgi:hypothetical protein